MHLSFYFALAIMDLNYVKTHNHELVPHKGFKLINGTHEPDDVDQIYNLEIRDSDVFVTYPISGESYGWKSPVVHTLMRHQASVQAPPSDTQLCPVSCNGKALKVSVNLGALSIEEEARLISMYSICR